MNLVTISSKSMKILIILGLMTSTCDLCFVLGINNISLSAWCQLINSTLLTLTGYFVVTS